MLSSSIMENYMHIVYGSKKYDNKNWQKIPLWFRSVFCIHEHIDIKEKGVRRMTFQIEPSISLEFKFQDYIFF